MVVLAERVVMMADAVTVADLLDGQVVLDIECLDRIYLSGFVNSLQTPGGVIWFLHDHRGMPIASPAVFAQIGDQFRRSVGSFAEANHIPVIRFKTDERKAEVMRPYLERAAATGRSQVAAIGVAREPQIVWTARRRDTDPGKPPQFSFSKENRRVTACYFYLWDDGFGQAFVKSALTSPIRSRSGSTGTNGPSARPSRPVSPSLSCPTASPPALTRTACKPSATGCSPAPSRCSSPAGWPGCRSR